MKVYLVLRETEFGDFIVDKVFYSQDKARNFVINKYIKNNPRIPQDQQIKYADKRILEGEIE